MSAAIITLHVERGTLRLTSELLFARVRVDATRETVAGSSDASIGKAAPSWLVVEFLAEETQATIIALNDGSFRFRLQIAKEEQARRDHLVHQILTHRTLQFRAVEERCDWIDA